MILPNPKMFPILYSGLYTVINFDTSRRHSGQKPFHGVALELFSMNKISGCIFKKSNSEITQFLEKIKSKIVLKLNCFFKKHLIVKHYKISLEKAYARSLNFLTPVYSSSFSLLYHKFFLHLQDYKEITIIFYTLNILNIKKIMCLYCWFFILTFTVTLYSCSY